MKKYLILFIAIISSTKFFAQTAPAYSSLAIGNNTTATGANAFATGSGVQANGQNSFAVGSGAKANSLNSIALGDNAIANGGVAIGGPITANGGIAIGSFRVNSTNSSIAMGSQVNNNNKTGSFAIGDIPYDNMQINNDADFQMLMRFRGGYKFHLDNAKLAFAIHPNGTVGIDQSNQNNGSLNYGLVFGNASGEGIASRRTGGSNQYGLDFYSNSTSRMSITNAGNVGIGNSAPAVPLAFANRTGPKISLYQGNGNSYYGFGIGDYQLQLYTDAPAGRITFGYYSNGTFTERMWLNNANGVLTIAGTAYLSDKRFKKQIHRIGNPLQKINMLSGIEYYLRSSEFPGMNFNTDKQVGLIAQEVEKVLPEAVHTNKETGYKSVDYARIVPLLIEGMKDQQQMIDKQQKQIDELQKMVVALARKSSL